MKFTCGFIQVNRVCVDYFLSAISILLLVNIRKNRRTIEQFLRLGFFGAYLRSAEQWQMDCPQAAGYTLERFGATHHQRPSTAIRP
jgi:hypothetical protein